MRDMTEPEKELRGRCALVTGSSRGIGRHIVIGLARAGADAAVHYRYDRAAAERTAEAVRQSGARAVIVQGDLTRAAECRRVVDAAAAALGGLDILVNNVGEFAYKPTVEHTASDFERIIAGTVGATFHCTLAALPYMRRRGWGRVVNLGAAAAERAAGRANVGPHLAGKAAVVSLTRTLAREEAGYGVTFNVVNPGVVDDRELTREEAVKMRDDQAPVGRPGTSQDVVDAVLFLASPRASFVNGAVLAVTGGWLA